MNRMQRTQIITLVLSLAFAPALSAKKAADSSAAHELSLIEKDAKKFELNKKAKQFKHNFEKLASRFESFAKKHPKSENAAVALIKAADLYERVAKVSKRDDDYEKVARLVMSAAELKTKPADKDALAMRAIEIYTQNLSDQDTAAEVIAPFLTKNAPKKKKAPSALVKSQAWYAQYQAQKKVTKKLIDARMATLAKAAPAKAQPAKAEPAKAEPEKKDDVKVASVGNVEVVQSENGVGLHVSVSDANIQIKQGVIPKSETAPRRVFFDLSAAKITPGVKSIFDVNHFGIKQIRVAQNSETTVRIVAEVENSLPITVRGDSKPVEIWFGEQVDGADESEAVEVADTTHAVDSEASVGADASVGTQRPDKQTVAKKPMPVKVKPKVAGLSLRKIVIDAGHGGHDPGAIGKGGLKEKDVTLAIAKKLKESLEENLPDVQVYLTRDTDKYLALGERTEFANNLDADLFISVHVNSSLNRKTQGVETYYLNISHDRYAVRLAARENAMSESEISNLEFILADLAMKSNVSDSVRLGREVQTSTLNHVQGTWSDVKDLGLKHALFYVLLGARMPAILVETSFISNRIDEKRLRTDKYQNAIVAGITKGVVRYSEQKQAMYQR